MLFNLSGGEYGFIKVSRDGTKMTEEKPSNPYSELSFWRFGLLAAVVMAFLPWSLLVHGMLR